MTAVSHRDPYQGVLQIVRFNWPKYLAAAACIGAAALSRPMLPSSDRLILLVVTMPVLHWTFASLLVSHLVYDRSHLYNLAWLARTFNSSPRRWLSIHCGLDETSALIAATFPDASGEVTDIFDPRAMTENSIRQARAAQSNAACSTPACFYALPFDNGAFDAVFCIFAAHELRRHTDRVRLFAEIARLLAPDGNFILVEHLRDWPNFLAFGPGFLHFHSWRAWRRAAREAGLTLRSEFPFTPFVRVTIFGRAV
jgi:SAM-dependent methyltransferase